MPEFLADLHIHSRYSRACSKDLSVAELAKWARLKGIGVLGTGDFTHPLWLLELQETLRASGEGLYEHGGQAFLLTTEVNTLFYVQGRAHQIHHVLLMPSLESVERLNAELAAFGDLALDGRPMLRLEAERLVRLVKDVEPRGEVIPAHIWTPHFSLFGSNSGFDTLEACFGQQTGRLLALETGLSSDPSMNWRLSALDRFALVSNSDSHSARKIGREANRFSCEMTYDALVGALRARDPARFLGTIEFFPEEGKYHWDGHRACGIRWSPEESRRQRFRCPACGRRVTIGVMHRVDELADRPEGAGGGRRPGFTRMVPLSEIIAEAFGVGDGTQAVEREYQKVVYALGTEFRALLEAPEEALRKAADPRVAEGILRVRRGQVRVEPGYDGEFGTVRLFDEAEPAPAAGEQLTLF
jgi:uncharacterized protein (TIGR00375 family)